MTKLRSNMKNHLMDMTDKLLLRQRSILETIVNQLKNISQIEHTHHRILTNCLVNVLYGLIVYGHQFKKPALHFVDVPNLALLIQNRCYTIVMGKTRRIGLPTVRHDYGT
ncbi:MAG: hypothetical protein H7X77_10730 [Anaerolineae bacterium]|nr:hypothetical protein [Anaerolineae bacterium]